MIYQTYLKRLAKQSDNDLTPEMIDFFVQRTEKHRQRVKDNLIKIAKKFDIDLGKAKEVGDAHDMSKYSDVELVPYIYLTWWHKHNDKGDEYKYPSGMKEKVDSASKSHVESNPHHPESHKSPEDMKEIDIAEMVADWASMSQEKKSSLKEWADKTVGKKYKFSDKQKDLIYNMIGLFE